MHFLTFLHPKKIINQSIYIVKNIVILLEFIQTIKEIIK